MEPASSILPLVQHKRLPAQLDIGYLGPEWRLADDLHLFREIPWEFGQETEDKSIFLSRFDDIILIVTVKLDPCIFEATAIDLRRIFKRELQVHRRISNVFDLYISPLYIRQLDIEVQLQPIDNQLLTLNLILLQLLPLRVRFL